MTETVQEQCSGVACLTPGEVAAGRPVSREAAFAPEYLGTATDTDVAAQMVGWMRPVIVRLGAWAADDVQVTRTGRPDGCGNEWVNLTLTPRAPSRPT